MDKKEWIKENINLKVSQGVIDSVVSTAKKLLISSERQKGKTTAMLIDALYEACSGTDKKIVFVSESGASSNYAFKAISDLVKTSAGLSMKCFCKDKTVKTTTGSEIVFIGSKESLRGQRANIVYLDEITYFASRIMDSIRAMLPFMEKIAVTISKDHIVNKREDIKEVSEIKKEFEQIEL